MTEILCLIASVAILCWSMATHPSRVECPRGWYAEGVRPDGETRCRPTPARDCPTTAQCDDGWLPGALEDRVWCVGGTVPVVDDDGRVVSCQARH